MCDFGARAWAPTVAFDGQRWIMLYGPDRLRAAVCDDARLDHWHEAPCTLVGAPLEAVLRDGMVYRLDDDSWLLYATGKRGALRHRERVRLREPARLALRAARAASPRREAPSNPSWAATESPFVFRHDGAYWLSITYTQSTGGPAEYHNTLLFRSDNPFDFGTYTGDDAQPAARLYAHAPEYLHDPDTGRWWITSCGWPGDRFQPVIPGSVAIRELDWV